MPLHNLTKTEQETLKTNRNDNHVTVLLCHYNGINFLDEQIDSILNQSHKNYNIVIRDDNSNTLNKENLKRIEAKHRDVITIRYNNQNVGFAANFLTSLKEDSDNGTFFAFADQDDIWHKDKLKKAVSFLSSVPEDIPALYCSRTEVIDKDGIFLGYSALHSKKPSFPNALVQNLGGGNTMVLNKKAKEIILEASKDTQIAFHDWWSYIIVSGTGGHCFYDSFPSLKYRQHNFNIIGPNFHKLAIFKRIFHLFDGRFHANNNSNIDALLKKKHLLTPKNKEIFELFCKSRNAPFFKRVWGLKKCGIYKQTPIDNLGLFIAIIFNKL